MTENHDDPNIVQRIVNAWDCCGTCAGGILAAELAAAAAKAWDEGYKQGGPMRDVNYDDPDAHTRNPYRAGRVTQ